MPNVKQIQPPGESSDPVQQEKCSLNEWMAKRVKAIQKSLNKSQLNVGRSSTKNDNQGVTFPFRLMRLFLVCDNKTMSCAHKRPLISCSSKQRIIHSAHPKIFQAIKYPLKGAGARAVETVLWFMETLTLPTLALHWARVQVLHKFLWPG